MTWVYGVDSSYDELTLAEANRLKSAGVEVYAQCLWTGVEQPEPAVRSLANAINAGLLALGYISITASKPGRWHVQQGRDGMPAFLWDALVKVPVDVELPGLTLAMVQDAHIELGMLGKSADVYTNYNTWVNVLGNPTRPPNCGLWNALWDEKPDFSYPRLPYGGWKQEEVWGEQWSGGYYVEGQFVDRNQFRIEALTPPLKPSRPQSIHAAHSMTDFVYEGKDYSALSYEDYAVHKHIVNIWEAAHA